MCRYIVLLLITGTVWAQTDFDKLISKAGTKYLGEYSKVEDKEVYFKPNNALEFQAVPLELIETLKLKNGTVLIQSGRINESALILKKFSNEYEKLTIEEKAIYDDVKKDARRWLAYPPLALIGAGGLATATFSIGENIFEVDDRDVLIPSIIGGGSLGMIGSYYLFNKLDKSKIEAINSFNNEDYEKFYLQEFKKRKSENIILSGSCVGLATGFAFLMFISSFNDFGGDFYFGP